MVEINYYSKYLKYKQKYLKQKNLQIGGKNISINIFYYDENNNLIANIEREIEEQSILIGHIKFGLFILELKERSTEERSKESKEKFDTLVRINKKTGFTIKFVIKNKNLEILDNQKTLRENNINMNDTLHVEMQEYTINIQFKNIEGKEVLYTNEIVNCLIPLNSAIPGWLLNKREGKLENFNASYFYNKTQYKLNKELNLFDQLLTKNVIIFIEEIK